MELRKRIVGAQRRGGYSKVLGGSAEGDGDLYIMELRKRAVGAQRRNGYRDKNNRICNVITHKALEVGIIIGGWLSNIIQCRNWS